MAWQHCAVMLEQWCFGGAAVLEMVLQWGAALQQCTCGSGIVATGQQCCGGFVGTALRQFW